MHLAKMETQRHNLTPSAFSLALAFVGLDSNARLSLPRSFNMMTPTLDVPSNRQQEIAGWLALYREPLNVSAWVVLDDDPCVLAHARFADLMSGHVVQCDCSCGLTKRDAQLAIQILQGGAAI